MGFFLRKQGMGLAAVAIASGVFLSRFLGLIRDKLISVYFGASLEADIYFTAFVIPDFINYLLAGGYFSITLVPLLAKTFATDEDDGWRFFSAAVGWAFLSIFLLTVLAWVFIPQLVTVVAPGYAPGGVSYTPAHYAKLCRFLRIILPAQVFFLSGACFTALLYYRRQFTIPALTPLIYNGAIIVCGYIGLRFFPQHGMEGFCWGALAGAALGSFLLPFLASAAGGVRFSFNLLHPTMKTLVLMALPLMIGQSIVVLDEQFIRIYGSLTGEGGVSLLNYARRIMLVPVGVVAQAAGVASYPFLASLAASGETEKFNQSLNTALINSVLVALPLSMWMIVAAEPVMRLVFQQGSFTPAAATQSAVLLGVMLTSVVFWVVQQVVGRAFYARQDTLTPAIAGSAVTLATMPLYWLGATVYGALGVALAGVAGVAGYTMVLCIIWIRRFGTAGLRRLGSTIARAILVGMPSASSAYGAALWIGRYWAGDSLWGAFARITASGFAFAAMYFILAWFFSPQLVAPLTGLWRAMMRKKTG